LIAAAVLGALVLPAVAFAQPGALATGSAWSWTQSSAGGFGTGKDNLGATPLVEYQGKLYAGAMNKNGAEALRRRDNGTWESVMSGGFGSKDNAGIIRMCVFNGYLYAGTINLKGCGLWRYDGSTWTDAISTLGPGFGNVHNIGVTALKVFKGRLYAGLTNYRLQLLGYGSDGAEIWSSDGSSWSRVAQSGFGDTFNVGVTALEEYSNFLYAGTARFLVELGLPDPNHVEVKLTSMGCKLRKSFDGATWAKVTASDSAGINDVKNVAVSGMQTYANKLYIGTTNGDLTVTLDTSSGEVTGSSYTTNGLHIYSYLDGGSIQESVGGGFGDTNDFSVTSMCVGGVGGVGKLLVGAASATGAGKLWSYDGSAWQPAANDGFGKPDNSAVSSLAVFGGVVFAGTVNSVNGCEVWQALPPPCPAISSIDPAAGPVGTVVTVKGSVFGDARGSSLVRFNTAIATEYPEWTDSEIKVLVPAGATSGPVAVTTGDGTSNSLPFTVLSPPHVSGISPASGVVGTEVTINGNSFGASRGSSYVTFKSVVATSYPAWSDGKITVKAPSGAASGQVTVTTAAGTSNGVNFTVTSKSPEPPKPPAPTTYPTWYLPEGTTGWGFSTYISIENPNGSPVTADLTYMTASGPVAGGSVALPANSQATINPAEKLGSQDFSTKVVCREGKTIAVDRTMTWKGVGAASEEAHSSIGVTAPRKTWYLPEGSSGWGFECWLLIQNPNSSEATCNVTYMIEGTGPRTLVKKVPPNSRRTFNMADDIGAKDASIKLESNCPVIPERAMYRDNRREGHDSIGTDRILQDCYLAEGTTAWGFTTYVLIQNPGAEAARVTVTYMTPSGPREQPPFTMPASSRKTIRVNDVLPGSDFSTHVHGSTPVIAERAMYWGEDTPLGEACHDSIGMTEPHSTCYLPDGETTNGRETWTLVQNPNATAVNVEISYLTASGTGNVTWTESIPANSRRTFSMADKGIRGRAAIRVTSKTSGKKIMVERAMYWNNRGAGTDTIGGFSD
jgi:hypothetical protein